MKRAMLAPVIAPILVALVFGIGAIAAIPIMILITMIAALPLFLISGGGLPVSGS